jgi:hypothetical protein
VLLKIQELKFAARLPKVVRAPEVGVTEQARKLLTQQLEKLVSVAVKDKDASLTKKKCREMLALLFGEQRVEEHKEHISAEVMRIMSELRQLEEEALVEFVQACRGVTEEEVANYSSFESGLFPFHSFVLNLCQLAGEGARRAA